MPAAPMAPLQKPYSAFAMCPMIWPKDRTSSVGRYP